MLNTDFEQVGEYLLHDNDYKIKVFVATGEYMRKHFGSDDTIDIMGAFSEMRMSVYINEELLMSRVEGVIAHEVCHSICAVYGVHFNADEMEECLCDFVMVHLNDINRCTKEAADCIKGYMTNGKNKC